MIFVSRCRLCHLGMDTVNHVFMNCPYAAALWSYSMNLFSVRINFGDTPLAILREAMKASFSSQLKALWIVGVISCF